MASKKFDGSVEQAVRMRDGTIVKTWAIRLNSEAEGTGLEPAAPCGVLHFQ